jgi:uncharacterized protein YdaU (DUF1376 family)
MESRVAEFAALPLFTDAWESDTKHLSRAARGLYMDLLILCWRSPGCRVPNDVDWISRKLACTSKEHAVLMQCISEFMSSDGNYLFQKRLLKEFQYSLKMRQKRSGAAKSRWAKVKEAYNADAPHMPSNASAMHPSPSPSPSPSPLKKSSLRSPKENGASEAKGARLPEGWEPLDKDFDLAVSWGLTQDEIKREHGRFVDHWKAKSGKDATKQDWDATWRNWMRKAADDKRNRDQRQKAFEQRFQHH